MPKPTHDFDLDNILSDSRIVSDAELKQSLRTRLQSIAKTAPSAEHSNGSRSPSQVPYLRNYERANRAMNNSRLIPAFAIAFVVILVAAFGAALLVPTLLRPVTRPVASA